jgi:hypothetical protein
MANQYSANQQYFFPEVLDLIGICSSEIIKEKYETNAHLIVRAKIFQIPLSQESHIAHMNQCLEFYH